ncbi:alpha-helical domain with a conserved Er motif [Haloferula helveola]|uniref:Alpha-helical domain with a conserved Er motif n=1 Tax=Haloferula helveola TaxID=490095 RepID=A0ABM7RGL3_9BACT|nr:alpha-helical domain with a conserved Er motif [Haloferula helveola]
MLSRVANSLYWMVRYIERADNLARLIEVNEQLVLDLGKIDRETLAALWRPVIASTGDEELFDEAHPDGQQSEAIHFLTVDRENPNSIASCVALARENARMVRDQLAEALWEELNGLYLFVNSDEGAWKLANDAAGYYEQIRRATHSFHGIAAATTLRGEAWDFMDLGRHLERADKTTRFLDITTFLERRIDEFGLTVDEHWLAILRSCGGLGAFRMKYRAKFKPRNIAEFLILSSDFPRSVRFCVDRVDQSLHAISGTPRGGFSDDAEIKSGQLLSALAYASIDDVLDGGLHVYLDSLQTRLNDIGEEIFRTYVLLPEQIEDRPPIPANTVSAVVRWQMEQQQQ